MKGTNIIKNPFKRNFKNSEEYVSYIAPKIFGKKLKQIVRNKNHTYYIVNNFDDGVMNAEFLLEHIILHEEIDIIDVPRNIRLEKSSYFIMAMRVSRSDFKKRFEYLKMYCDDLIQFDKIKLNCSKDKWYDVFAVYTSEALKQCLIGRPDITVELRNDFMDFLFNLPQEIRNQICVII